MTLSNFENYVPSKILARGEEYYITDAIESLEEVSPGVWNATVIGSDEYSVNVCLKGDEVISWDCDCPYDGDLCKHVVAVLLTIRNNKKKKCFTPQVEEVLVERVEEAPMLTEEEAPVEMVDENIKKLVSFIEPKVLATFVSEYASTHTDLKEALQQRFAPVVNKTNPVTDYSKAVRDCFVISYRKPSSYNRYADYDEESDIDLEIISSQLNIFLDKAVFLLEQKSFGDVASIILQIFRSIGECCDEDQEYEVYDQEYLFTDSLETAVRLLLELAENKEVPQSLKDSVLDELCDIATFDSYKDYGLFEIETLLDDFNRISQTKEGAMTFIDKMLSEENKDSYRRAELITQKIELLHALDRHKEAEKIIESYLYLPPIRKIKIARLLEDKKSEEALQTIDEGIKIAVELENRGTVFDWKKEKLNIYQQTNNISQIIVTAKEMFISDSEKMDSYHLLKKYISPGEWKPFLKSIMEQADLSSHSFLDSSITADIYVEEKEEEQLLDFLKKVSPNRQLTALRIYGRHLKENHSAEVLALYVQRIQEYAEQNMGRSHYAHVADVLRMMKGYYGGHTAVNELVQLFRTKYKKRPAMMDELKSFR